MNVNEYRNGRQSGSTSHQLPASEDRQRRRPHDVFFVHILLIGNRLRLRLRLINSSTGPVLLPTDRAHQRTGNAAGHRPGRGDPVAEAVRRQRFPAARGAGHGDARSATVVPASGHSGIDDRAAAAETRSAGPVESLQSGHPLLCGRPVDRGGDVQQRRRRPRLRRVSRSHRSARAAQGVRQVQGRIGQ